ncbi:MAG: H4MPT-linked C1 transfer pathway protein [Methanomicrobiales archaeon]|nr:H4MPT-linked C1 transfer pathway protein [Methanomicrobiales archaeon]
MIGIDVGGANLKVVDDRGTHIHYCPLWENAPVTDLLVPYAAGTSSDAAVVMSGELADCFEGKLQGIRFIVSAVQKAFPRARFYGMDGRFHDTAVPALAAANWLASADYLRSRYPDAVLLDIGSTTADIIPLNRFNELTGLTDTLRLQKGYLIYTGMLRTSLPTLLGSVTLSGVLTPVSTEYFATSADAHLVLGHIGPEQYSCDTPDRKEKTVEASLRRLARVVCADLEEIGREGAVQVAEQFWHIQKNLICDRVRTIAGQSGAHQILVAGIGAPLFARELGATDLTHELGSEADALPALAVREIARVRTVF